MSQSGRYIPLSGPGSGTVTSISEGTGITLTPNPITATGTVALTVPVIVSDGGTGNTTFTPYAVITAGTTATGAFQNVVGVGTSGQVLTSAGASALPAWMTPSSGVTSVTTSNATPQFVLTGSTENVNFNLSNLVLGSSLPSLGSASANVGVGSAVLNSITNGNNNVAIGFNSGHAISTGSFCTFVGSGAGALNNTSFNNTGIGGSALAAFTTGAGGQGSNTAVGSGSMIALTTGTFNTALGISTLSALKTGSYNTVIGYGNSSAGSNYTTSESSNVLLSNVGVLGESNVMRLGTSGTGTGQVGTTYIAGISGVNVGSVSTVVTSSGDQLGTAVLTAGTGITITPTANTITIAASGSGAVSSVTGTTNQITASPTTGAVVLSTPSTFIAPGSIAATTSVTASSGNVTSTTGNLVMPQTTSSSAGVLVCGGVRILHAYGAALDSNIFVGETSGNFTLTSGTAKNNAGFGINTLNALTVGISNCMLGAFSGQLITSGSFSCSIGENALSALLTGSYNLALGWHSGQSYTSSESSNILLNNLGTVGESNVLRIGAATGTGNQDLKAAFICGIAGVNVGSVATVVTESGDQLGTAVLTAGANITITPGANTITIAANASSATLNYTGINHASSPYTVLSTDDYISADVTAGVISVLLPNAPTTGRVFTIKDKVGLSATSNITVTTVGGSVTIDGATSFVMNTAYQAISLIFNGTSYEIY